MSVALPVSSIPGCSLPAVFSFLYVLYSEFLVFLFFSFTILSTEEPVVIFLLSFFYTSSYIYHAKEHTNAKNNPFFFSYHLLPIIRPATQLIKNAAISAATIVEPTGVPASMDNKIPITAQITDNITEHKVTQKRS